VISVDVASFKKLPVSQVASKIKPVGQTVKVRDILPTLSLLKDQIMAVVDDSEKLVGVVTSADVLNPNLRDLLESTLKDSGLVEKEPVTVPMDMTIEDAVRTMRINDIDKLIVVDDRGRPFGFVTKTSTLREFDRMYSPRL